MCLISIICPVYNEEKYIEKCINSILAQTILKENNIELFLIDGGSSDSTRKIIKEYTEQYPFITMLENPHKYTPFALNIGIKTANGEYIARIDAHAEYPQDYLEVLLKYSIELDADNIGTVIETLPCDTKSTSKIISFSLSHRFGVGNSLFRVGASDIRKVDTVPFGFFKKVVFEKIGYYDESLLRNEDDEFNGRMIKNQLSIYLIPFIKIKYYPRNSYSKLSSMMYQYGLYKPIVVKKLGFATSYRQLAPPLFVLFLLFGILFSLFSNIVFTIFSSIMLIYLLLITWPLKEYYGKYKSFNIGVSYSLFLIHLSYGSGYLIGVIHMLMNKKNKINHNR
ncbi:WblJ protein [Morganella morganii]|uniref:glycosyltransferase family 2 protein n=1 Tax=Morganella morganii TaxID=582 RepID=UPI0006C55C08|nr:glycosyltransferase family 2 protein [Morganella morganii]EKW7746471.1 glycosyltransferase family 2 protein [Morganella morganii]KOO18074.1 WblJ protein [Morganella morganii]HCR3199677.1 glycosyltransferase family 2 protein [Morganella morganii]